MRKKKKYQFHLITIPIIYDILADSQRFRIKDHELIILKKRTLYCTFSCVI